MLLMILKRSNARPDPDTLSAAEARTITEAFDVYAGEVLYYGQSLRWDTLEEVNVVKAARYGGLAGWLVRFLVHGDDRYHVGLYAGGQEYVMPNVSLNTARYVVQTIAYYAPQPVRYEGIEGLSPLVEL